MSKMSMEQFQRKIENWKKGQPGKVKIALNRAADLVIKQSQRQYLTGPRPERLGVVTGRLRRSINKRVTVTGSRIKAEIGTNVKYAPVHEFGTTIRAKNAKYLRFKIGDQWVSKKEVKIPARPFLSTAVKDMRLRVLQMISQEMMRGYDHG